MVKWVDSLDGYDAARRKKFGQSLRRGDRRFESGSTHHLLLKFLDFMHYFIIR